MTKHFLLLLVLLITSSASAATFYVSTGGSGTTCSNASPCAISRISTSGVAQPGDTWLLKNGTYSGTPALALNCSSGVNNGTSGSPITVQAENERQAFLSGDGSGSTLSIVNCSWWNFVGLRIEGADNAGQPSGGSVVYVGNSSNLVFQRNILQKPNRYANTHLFEVYNGGANVSWIENELYNFHRHAISIATNNGGYYIARNYCNSRGYPDLDHSKGGYESDGDGGDACFVFYPAHDSLAVNNISENNLTMFEVNAPGNADDNRFYGNLSLNDARLAFFDPRGNNDSLMPHRNRIANSVAINSGSYGISSRSTNDTRCDRCSFLNPTTGGIIADNWNESSGGGPSTWSVGATNTLVVGGTYGFTVDQQQGGGSIDHVNTYGTVTPFNSTGGSTTTFTNATTTDPNLGSCLAWIPDGTPMKTADIGANVLYEYDTNGSPTTVGLWNTSTGAFVKTGASVTGLNDSAGSSLFDIQDRLNINKNGCSFPSSYSGAPVLTVGIDTPTSNATYSTNQTTVTLSGLAADDIAVTSVTWSCDVCGSGTASQSLVGGTTVRWTVSNLPLQLGVNVITVSSHDADKHDASTIITITRVPLVTGQLVLGLSLDTGSGTTALDTSGHNNNGSFGSGVIWDDVGKYGKALAFDGSSAVTIQNSSSLQLVNMTLELWVFPTAAYNEYKSLIVKNYDYLLYGWTPNDNPYCFASNPVGGIVSGTTDTIGCTNSALPLNTWTHLAVTYDGLAVKIYQDGALVRTLNSNAGIPVNSGVLQIGGSQYGEYFVGKIDEVRVYSRALTQAEIQTDMITPVGTGIAGPSSLRVSAASSLKGGAGSSIKGGNITSP